METRWLEGAAGPLQVKYLPASGPQVLLVHGAWSSSWYWEEHFMPFLAAEGFAVTALNLRAHGASAGRFRWSSLNDYIDDLRRVAEGLDDPVIVGHSLGGFITQSYVNRYGARAAALLASVPHYGAWKSLLRVAFGHPGALFRTLFSLNLRGVLAHPGDARSLLYSRGPAQTDKDALLRHRYDESFRVLLDLLVQPLTRPWPVALPKLILGAGEDRLFSPAEVRATARFHGTEAQIIPGASHMLMVDDDWPEAARLLSTWLKSL